MGQLPSSPRSFGPWASSIVPASPAHLSLFWRQRLFRLGRLPRGAPSVSKLAAAAVLIMAIALVAMPTLQTSAGPAPGQTLLKDIQPPSSPPAAGTALTYTGTVVDKATGKPIAGATVTVRRMILAPGQRRVLAEPQYRTDASGKYEFTIPPEQAADRYLYIELDVSHPDYATRRGFGYALSMIRKNEKIGGKPFFERVELTRGEPITGTVVTPDGKPAVRVKVLAFSMDDRHDFDSMSLAPAWTDSRGVFRINLVKAADAIFWLLPNDYAPSMHVLGKKRGDLGRFTLRPGIRATGRVLDQHGRPVAGVWVNAFIIGGPAKQQYSLPVAEMLARSGLTDSEGRFALAPLPPGDYLLRIEEYPFDSLVEDRTHRPVPAVFGPQAFTLKPGQIMASVEIRALPDVVVEGEFYDSHGKPRSGHEPSVWGRMPGQDLHSPSGFYTADGTIENGRFLIRVPRGLQEAKLTLMTNEHSALRVRMKKGDPLSNHVTDIPLGTLNSDIRGIEVIRYDAPILLVKPMDEKGTIIKDAKLRFQYGKGRSRWEDGGRFVDGHDVAYERQSDGRLRSEQLLPDEEVAVTVSAPGHQSKTQTLKLPEGAIKELEVTLPRVPAAGPRGPGPGDNAGKTQPSPAPSASAIPAARPVVKLDVEWRGAITVAVEAAIATPLYQNLLGMQGMGNASNAALISRPGKCEVYVQGRPGQDPAHLADQVEKRLRPALPMMPARAEMGRATAVSVETFPPKLDRREPDQRLLCIPADPTATAHAARRSVASPTPTPGAGTLLADAVRTFNARAEKDPVGKDQTPLREEEVIAAVQWALLHPGDLSISKQTLEGLRGIVETRRLPAGFELEVLSRFEPNDRIEFTKWSVRLLFPALLAGTSGISIREVMLDSRQFGPEERKVIAKWKKLFSEDGISMSDEVEYDKQRAEAAALDRASSGK